MRSAVAAARCRSAAARWARAEEARAAAALAGDAGTCSACVCVCGRAIPANRLMTNAAEPRRFGAMRIEGERSKSSDRWSMQTTGSIDRAIAMLLIGALVLVGYLIGFDAEIPLLLGP